MKEADEFDGRGGAMWLSREEWGVVIDALIEHRESAAGRKRGNVESTSDVRADMCKQLIARVTTAAATLSAPPDHSRPYGFPSVVQTWR